MNPGVVGPSGYHLMNCRQSDRLGTRTLPRGRIVFTTSEVAGAMKRPMKPDESVIVLVVEQHEEYMDCMVRVRYGRMVC